MATLDHIVLGAATLAEGAALLERLFGVHCEAGGRHEGAGTHNLLLGLGPDAYLEVIAIDPDQSEPAQPRLFRLDEPNRRAELVKGPQVVGWVARTDRIEAEAARLGAGLRTMRRGGLAWRMAIPPPEADWDGLLPPLIQWDGPAAVERLTDSGLRLHHMAAGHRQVAALSAALTALGLDLLVEESSRTFLDITLHAPNGNPHRLGGV